MVETQSLVSDLGDSWGGMSAASDGIKQGLLFLGLKRGTWKV